MGADGLEDVDFAAVGPMIAFVIVAEEPEGWPDAFAGRQLDAGFEASIFLREVVSRVDARGGVVADNSVRAGEIFSLCGDDEVAVLLLNVGRSVGVGFELIVAEAVAASDDVPL